MSAPTIREQWDRLRAAHDAAVKAADVAELADDHAANRTEYAAWMELMKAEAPDFTAVLWKLVEIFGEAGRERIEGGYADAWLFQLTDVILSDVERLNNAFAEAWLSSWTKAGGSVVIDDEGKAQASYSTYDLSPLYRAPRSELGEQAERQDGCWNDGHYYGTMKALFAGLQAVPGGGELLKAHMRAKGVRVIVPVGTGAV